MLFHQELGAMNDLLANELAGSAVNGQPVELCHYRLGKLCFSVGQIADQSFPQRDV